MNKPPYIMRDNSITVFVDGQPHTIDSSHSNFSSLRQAILDAKYDLIPSLVTIEGTIKNMTFGAFDIYEGKLFHNGVEIHGVVVDKLFAMLKEGAKDAKPLLNFIDRLMDNPSANSVNELYNFLSYKSLPITPDGTGGRKNVCPVYPDPGQMGAKPDSGGGHPGGGFYGPYRCQCPNNFLYDFIVFDRFCFDRCADRSCDVPSHSEDESGGPIYCRWPF